MPKRDSQLRRLPGKIAAARTRADRISRATLPDTLLSEAASPAEKSRAADAIIVWESLLTLTRGLGAAFRDLEKQRDARTMRHRYVAALWRISDFARSTGMGSHIEQSLSDLGTALYELDFGVVAPVLEKPQGVNNRSFDPFPIWQERTRLVLAYDLLLEAGMTSRAAFKAIREYGAFEPLLEPSSAKGRAGLEGSVQSWRKRLKKGTVKSPIAQSCHKRNIELLDLAKSSATPSQIYGFARKFLEAGAAATAELAASGQ